MRAVGIADLKNNLSRYLNEVRAGEEVLIKDRDRPIARIVPVSAADEEESELLALAAAGKVRLPETTEPLPESFWTEPLPKVNADVVGILREDRDAR
ncbi:MAG TPA: type II toxin-antitoxin system prevent-host-death family antitoxin [Blastocatellia bacterium]|nr:type II toxin-antitoxin system prevent-host-death family antitoxin [Blastocatellia bacterium]